MSDPPKIWLHRLHDYLITIIQQQKLAYILLMIASILFSAGFIFVNQSNISPFEVGVPRGLVILLLTRFLSYQLNYDLSLKGSSDCKFLLLRNTLMILHVISFSFAMFYLPLPYVGVLSNIGPIFVSLIDYFIYGVTINQKQTLGILISFIGVIILINGATLIKLLDPQFQQRSTFPNYISSDPLVLSIASLVLVLGAMGQSVAIVMTKKLQNMNSTQINYYQGIQIIVMSALLYPVKSQGTPMTGMQFLGAVVLCGIPVSMASMLYTTSLYLTRNYGVLSTLQFTSLVFSYGISLFRYGENVNFVCTAGAVCIVIGIVTIVLNKP